jgi:hypothetical protein
MGQVFEGGCCSLCGKCRSGRTRRAEKEEGMIAQVCLRKTCAEIKHLLRKALRNSSNASSLVVEVYHYYHTNRLNEDRIDRTYIYRSELYTESLPKDRAMLPVREEPPPINPFTKPSENVVRQRLYNVLTDRCHKN